MDELNKIIDRYTEGNYLISKTAKEEMAKDILALFSVMHLLTEYEKFASGDNYIGSKELIDKQIKEFIEVNCA